ncbi:hypothetical protein PSHT_12631 [Puccinia striiformis]|uniref:Integrase core domain-containing protein n=1 Tax=Puccinia striiformis TaxID=27350 RepID=A0A2S4UVE6_9BASI|nr:hypothetical protein PSHT_12631 [Puccinia striiformis]
MLSFSPLGPGQQYSMAPLHMAAVSGPVQNPRYIHVQTSVFHLNRHYPSSHFTAFDPMGDISTSDYDTEHSGSDDPMEPDLPGDIEQKITRDLLAQGLKGPKILTILKDQYKIKISPRNFSRKRKQWGLQQSDLPKGPPPAVQASIRSSHCKGLTLNEMKARLFKETRVNVAIRTLQRYLQVLQLKQLTNDLEDGRISLAQVIECINHARTELLLTSAGYRSMHRILKKFYSISIPRTVLYEILQEIDPDGLALRLRQACKRRIFRVNGPNHVWACDGHDKLKKFGICIYGMIDAWSRKILGMFVHVTNNDPKHIGVYFLQTAAKAGGIPLKVTTDFGTETIDMAAHQMFLSHHYAGISAEEAGKRMHFTKSTHNQKIEALWSQMMKQHNRKVIDVIQDKIDEGEYDPHDEVQKLLFLFLWIPVFQTSVDRWVYLQNNSRKRRDHRISLPTACTPDFSYSTPESFGTTDQLVNVPANHLEQFLHQNYPDQEAMFTHTPPWFHDVATGIMEALNLRFHNISLGSVWIAFDHMLPYIKNSFSDDQPLPSYGWPPAPLIDSPHGSDEGEDNLSSSDQEHI